MIELLCFFLTLLASPFKSKSRLGAENAALRHQLIVLQRRVGGRVQLTNGDRLFLVTVEVRMNVRPLACYEAAAASSMAEESRLKSTGQDSVWNRCGDTGVRP